MTTTEISQRLDFEAVASTYAKAMSHLDNSATKELDKADIDHRLRELLRIRVSQLNGCAYCVDMHTKDARAVGESEQRIYALPVWQETPFFDARERAALAFAEQVALVSSTHVPAEAYSAAAAEFDDAEIGALLALIVTVSAWNMLSVTTRAWEPGSYQPN
jgi:AhpD family alkylhydroperoxidase